MERVVVFKQALDRDKELRDRFEAEMKRIMEGGEATSPSDLVVKAAKAVGYDFTRIAYEKYLAARENLSEEALKAVTGGSDSKTEWCVADYACYTLYNHDTPNTPGTPCLADYSCIQLNMDNKMPYPGQQCEVGSSRYNYWSCDMVMPSI